MKTIKVEIHEKEQIKPCPYHLRAKGDDRYVYIICLLINQRLNYSHTLFNSLIGVLNTPVSAASPVTRSSCLRPIHKRRTRLQLSSFDSLRRMGRGGHKNQT